MIAGIQSIAAWPPIATSANDFVKQHDNQITALAILVIALVVAKVVDFAVGRRAERLANSMVRGDLSQGAITRLRVLRRVIFAAIVLIGFGLALNQIAVLRPFGTALLASSAVLGIVLGFAARQTIANGVAGVMLATVQPFRVGDVIEWEDNRGTVEDLTLSYTFVRLPSGHLLVVSNERMAAGPLENFTIGGRDVEATATVAVIPARAAKALSTLRERLDDCTVSLGECAATGVEINIAFRTDVQSEAARRDRLREQAVEVLADAGILHDEPPAG